MPKSVYIPFATLLLCAISAGQAVAQKGKAVVPGNWLQAGITLIPEHPGGDKGDQGDNDNNGNGAVKARLKNVEWRTDVCGASQDSLSSLITPGVTTPSEIASKCLKLTWEISRGGQVLVSETGVSETEWNIKTLRAAPGHRKLLQVPIGCTILDLNLGPLDLNLLGLAINLEEVVLNITAVPGAGNLLGNLLCAIVNLLNPGGPLSDLLQIIGIINQLNEILGGILG